MFERREELEKFYEVVEKFRQKGAVSPDKAMTVEELGLPPGFEAAMKRRLGRSGIFVEVNGRYYLSEGRLKQIEELRSSTGSVWALRKRIMTLRIVQMITAILFLALFLVSFFIQSWELRLLSHPLLRCLASDIGNTALLPVKNQKDNVFKNSSSNCRLHHHSMLV